MDASTLDKSCNETSAKPLGNKVPTVSSLVQTAAISFKRPKAKDVLNVDVFSTLGTISLNQKVSSNDSDLDKAVIMPLKTGP